MKLISRLFFGFTLLLFSYTSYAQKQRDHYDLLWKISGNGLTKPSYLFGTMHLSDRRVFDFSDSVITKIKECEGFALEFAPDSISELMTHILLERSATDTVKHDFKKDLTETEYAILKEKLLAETSLNLDKVKDKTPKQIADLLNAPSLYNNDKVTFLDAYLYRIALGEKKVMHGLEEINDEKSMSKSDYEEGMKDLKEIIYSSEYQKSLEGMIQLYHDGNIEKLYQYVTKYQDTSSSNILNRRNHKMIASIQNFSSKQSVFYAVGAAHLPGEEGLIELLRKKGYTVTLVPSAFTGYATSYKPKPVEFNWQQYRFEDEGYAISLPGKPVEYSDKKKVPFAMRIYPNIATGAFYFVMSIPFPGGGMEESQMEGMADNFVRGMLKGKNTKGLKKKAFSYKGTKATEVDFYDAKDKMYGKVRILQKYGLIYIQMIISYKKEALKTSDIKLFLESLEFIKPKEVPVVQKEMNKDTMLTLKHYVSKPGAYSIDAVCELEKYDRDYDTESGISKAYFLTGEDKDGLSYWAGYYLLPRGVAIVEDSVYLAKFANSMTSNTPDSISQIKDIVYKGYSGKEFYKKEKNGYLNRVKILLRGSRIHMLFVIGRPSKINSPQVQQFMESLEFLSYEKAEWHLEESKEHGFSWNTKGHVSMNIDTTYNQELPYEISYDATDSCTSIPYVVSVSSYSPYYFIPKGDFIEKQRQDYVGKTDSILQEKKYKVNGIEGVEWIIKVKESHNLKRVFILPIDNKIICMCTYILPELVKSEFSDPFFSSFKFNDSKAKTTLFESKSQKLLSDLSSSDTLTRTSAIDMLYYYNFQPEDKKLLYAQLQKKYADDSIDYDNTRSVLLSRLIDVEDSTTVPFIEELYTKLSAYPGLQIQVLKTLLNLKSKISKDTFVRMINTEIPLVGQIPSDFFYALEDSIELRKALYEELFTLMKSTPFRNNLYSLSFQLIDSNLIPREFFVEHLDQLIAFSKEDLDEAWDYNPPYLAVWNSITFFGRFTEQKEVVDFLVYMSHYTNDVLAYEALSELLTHEISVDPKVLERFAAHDHYRLRLYNLLEKHNILSMFPAKWLKQEYFAEANMYDYMNDNEYYYEKIELINSKVIPYKGVPARFFLFKLLSEDDWYVGISGPFSLDKKDVYTSGEATNNLHETLKSKSINDHYKDLLNEREVREEE